MSYYGISANKKTLKKLANSLVIAIVLVGQLPLVAVASKITGDDHVAVITNNPNRTDVKNEQTFVVPKKRAIKIIRMDATAYTSRVEECDGNPFITADGSVVADGVIATNVLPFGTRVRLPTVYGDKVFEVRDRMNSRYTYRLDVWMNDYDDMIQFGLKRNIPVEVIEMGTGEKNWEQWKGRTAEMNRIGKYGPPADPLFSES
ncbi:3D domain-containing protein [Candidatus Uhrbacteria bacterium]|nr:3D domain-containing protein [Candidatus Uhrbacteria bacterium]